MISRRATLLLAEIYKAVFTGTYKAKIHKVDRFVYENKYEFKINELHDFLFIRDYPEWFLLAIRGINTFEERSALEFIKGLHTGSFLHQLKVNPNSDQYNQMTAAGKELLPKLAQDIIVFILVDKELQSQLGFDICTRLLHQLEMDGYIFLNNKLYSPESNILDLEEETGLIHHYIKNLNLGNQEIVLHHLDLIETDYLDGKWDDSIGNSRKFLESVLQEIADKHSITIKGKPLSTDTKKWAFKVRQYLESEKLFTEPEIKALKETYGLMSETGNHPYIAEKDQAILMRNLSLTFAHFALLRYLGWPKIP